ncbi:MAG: ABC transporter permease [Gemmatimonadota bacterium]
MTGERGMLERMLRWAVGDAEATEGLLGDLEEERSARGGGTLRYRLALLGLVVRYAFFRMIPGRGPEGADAGASRGRELRFALRSLVRAPAFTLGTLSTLALGLGATTAVYTVVDAVVLRPLPYPGADQLVRLESAVPGLEPDARWHLARGQYLYFRDEVTTLGSLGLYVSSVTTVGSVEEPDQQAERVRIAMVNPDLPRVLGIEPLLGRAFTEEESLDRDPRVVMISHGYWQRAFGGDPTVVGRSVLVEGRPAEIVGILPEGGRLPEEASSPGNPMDLWLPLYLDPAARAVNQHTFRSVGRMAPGTDVAAVNAELAGLSARLPDVLPTAYSQEFMTEYGFRAVATPLHEDVVGRISGTLWIVFGSVALLLLVGCFNAANLVMARTQRRQRELAIRAALGAGRSALARQLLLESMVLALAAGAAGLVLGAWGVRSLVALAPEGIPRLDQVALGGSGVLFMALLSGVIGAVIGIVPLAGVSRRAQVLGDTGRGLTPSRRHHALRRALVVGQLAVSLVLLAGATLLFRSFRNLTQVETGLDIENVLTFRVVLPFEHYGEYELAGQFYRQASEVLGTLPGVERVGLVSALPLSGFDGCAVVYVEDPAPSSGDDADCLPVILVGPGYFESVGIPVRGRTAEWSDIAERTMVPVVSEAFARRFWPGDDPLGRGVSGFGAPMAPTAGVVGDVRGAGLSRPVWDALYLSMLPGENGNWAVPRFMHFTVRTDGTDPLALVPAVRRSLQELDPRVPLSDLRTLESVVAASTARDSFIALLLGVASALSLLLSALGVYAVVTYLVQGRRAEIGVRLALGADRDQVRRLVLVQSLGMAGLGVVLGVLFSLPLSRVLRSVLYGVSPTDPLTLALVSLTLIGLAGAASLAPAVRATRVDPVEALRSE